MSFLRNAWYVAAWADEVAPGALIHRTLLNEPVLLFRDSKGEPHALIDRCPHRFAPLHRGKHLGDRIQCGYHGLEFNSEGRCVHNPHSDERIPGAVRVKSYPLCERHSFLWIWMGEASGADPATIPDFSFQDPAESYVGKRYLLARAGYLLEVDNILDLSHIQFVHPTTLGSGDVSKGHYASSVDGETVWSKRSTHAEVMPEFLYRARNIPSGVPCDRWIDVRWNAPANMALFAGAVPTGEPRTAQAGVSQAHVFTPETVSSTHYWFGISFPRSLGEVGERMAREQVDGLRVPFEEEDLPMLEAQQRNIDQMSPAQCRPLLFKIDAASAHARKILERKLAAEQAAARAEA
jgi:phenylpropionate dioxygenase-like ring-hydroxylating dioxygenase large terminal subunit